MVLLTCSRHVLDGAYLFCYSSKPLIASFGVELDINIDTGQNSIYFSLNFSPICPSKNSKCSLICYMNVSLNALTLLDLALNIVVTQKHYFFDVIFV